MPQTKELADLFLSLYQLEIPADFLRKEIQPNLKTLEPLD